MRQEAKRKLSGEWVILQHIFPSEWLEDAPLIYVHLLQLRPLGSGSY